MLRPKSYVYPETAAACIKRMAYRAETMLAEGKDVHGTAAVAKQAVRGAVTFALSKLLGVPPESVWTPEFRVIKKACALRRPEVLVPVGDALARVDKEMAQEWTRVSVAGERLPWIMCAAKILTGAKDKSDYVPQAVKPGVENEEKPEADCEE